MEIVDEDAMTDPGNPAPNSLPKVNAVVALGENSSRLLLCITNWEVAFSVKVVPAIPSTPATTAVDPAVTEVPYVIVFEMKVMPLPLIDIEQGRAIPAAVIVDVFALKKLEAIVMLDVVKLSFAEEVVITTAAPVCPGNVVPDAMNVLPLITSRLVSSKFTYKQRGV